MKEHRPKREILSESIGENTSSMGFEELVRGNAGWMLALASRILSDNEQAQDVVQNAFASIHKGLKKFENRASLKTWMHRIVINEALMVLRKTKRLKEQPLDGLTPQFDDNGCRIVAEAVTWDTPETKLTSQQTNAIVRTEINSLPETHKLVLILRDIEGISTSKVAEILNISEANVRVKLHRARAALKKRLEPMILRGAL